MYMSDDYLIMLGVCTPLAPELITIDLVYLLETPAIHCPKK